MEADEAAENYITGLADGTVLLQEEHEILSQNDFNEWIHSQFESERETPNPSDLANTYVSDHAGGVDPVLLSVFSEEDFNNWWNGKAMMLEEETTFEEMRAWMEANKPGMQLGEETTFEEMKAWMEA